MKQERRAKERLCSSDLIFTNPDASNGGLVFNITEAGIAVSSAQPLSEDRFIALRIQFPGSLDWVDVSGQIKWKSQSKKEAGIAFAGSQNEAHRRIRSWIASQTSSGEFHSEAKAPFAGPPEKTLRRTKTRVFSEAPQEKLSWKETGPPDSVRNEQQDVRNWLFPLARHQETPRRLIASPSDSFCTEPENVKDWLFSAASFRERPVYSERSAEGQPTFHTETKNAPGRLVNRVAEKQFFPSSACTYSDVPLNRTERKVAQPAAPQTQEVSTKQKLSLAETHSSVAERRRHRRAQIAPFGYLQMEESNGGIVLNISEGGVAITTSRVLTDDHLPGIKIQFPGVSGWIETTGEIIWKSESKKEAGVRFVGLAEEARQRISDWISAQAAAENVQELEQIPKIPEKQEKQLQIADLPGRESPIYVPPAPAEKAKEFEEAPLFSLANASSSQRLEKGSTAPLSSRKQRSKHDSGPGRRMFRKRFLPGVPLEERLQLCFVLAVFLLIFWEWILPRPDSRLEISAPIKEETQSWVETLKKPATPWLSATPSAPTAQAETKNTEQPQVAPPLAINKNENPGSRPLDNLRRRLPAARPAAKPVPQAPSPPAKSLLASGQTKTPSRHIAASANRRPLRNTLQTASSAVPAPPQLESGPIQPMNPAPLTTNTTQPPAPKGKQSSMLPAKQPSAPANYMGAVAIVADPYPALRLPDGNSKKQHPGSSLEIGHLISRVEPVYPEEAKQQGIQGTVKLHAIIDKHGSVERLEAVNGSPILVAAAMNAVHQWRYSETLLGGKSVETEEYIAIIFRLSNSETPKE